MARVLFQLLGQSGDSSRPWAVTSSWTVSSDVSSEAQLLSIVTAVATVLPSNAAFKAGISTNMQTKKLRALHYPGSSVVSNMVVEAAMTTAGTAAPAGGSVGPPSLAVVVTERTSTSGASYRGRSFWPCTIVATGTKDIPAAIQTAVRASWRAFHDAVQAAFIGQSLFAVHSVYSRKLNTSAAITRYGTGSRIDIVRARDGKDEGTYTYDTAPETMTVTQEQLGQPLAGYTAESVQALLDAYNEQLQGQGERLIGAGGLTDNIKDAQRVILATANLEPIPEP